jgi:ribosomal protein L40E
MTPTSAPLLLLFLIVMILIVATASSRRRRMLDSRRFDLRVCGHCGTSQPPHAVFCRSCGRRL